MTQTLNEEQTASQKVIAQSKPTLKESASQGDEEEDDNAKPTTAKEKESDRKSKQDEAGARLSLKKSSR